MKRREVREVMFNIPSQKEILRFVLAKYLYFVSCILYAVISSFRFLDSIDSKLKYRMKRNSLDAMTLRCDVVFQLVDFGFAKRTRNRTYTVCGTPDYLAPEIIRAKVNETYLHHSLPGV